MDANFLRLRLMRRERGYNLKKVINGLCVILAFISLMVGCIGILIPVLPTTPFLMLSLLLFARGSERFHRWFLSTKLYKNHLEDFVATKSLTRAGKIKILAMITVVLGIGFWFSPFFVKVILLVVALFHYLYFLFGIKTAEKKEVVKDGLAEN